MTTPMAGAKPSSARRARLHSYFRRTLRSSRDSSAESMQSANYQCSAKVEMAGFSKVQMSCSGYTFQIDSEGTVHPIVAKPSIDRFKDRVRAATCRVPARR
jgi:hypothetical protein